LLIGIAQVELGFTLAAPAGPGLVGANGASVTPKRHHQVLAIFDDVERARVERIHLEMIGCTEVALGFHIESRQSLVMQYVFRRTVALEDDQLVIRGFNGGRLTFTLNQFAVNRRARRLRGLWRFRERRGSESCEQNDREQPHISILVQCQGRVGRLPRAATRPPGRVWPGQGTRRGPGGPPYNAQNYPRMQVIMEWTAL